GDNPNSTNSPYRNQEKIPGAEPTSEFIPYLQSIINFGFAVIGILALFMLIIGAYQYLMAAGSGNASDAKDTITSALLGLILGLCAWIILNTINPDLVKMNPITQIQGTNTSAK
ncbi:MAG TPA: pilin, partial [Candidatus Saccharimonadales bacterium]|nr:pilin [Candidatus Saccharimonadales bacterium]